MEDETRDNRWAVTAIALGAALALLVGLWLALRPTALPTDSRRTGSPPPVSGLSGLGGAHGHHGHRSSALGGPTGPAGGDGAFGGGASVAWRASMARHTVVVSISSPSTTESRTQWWYLGSNGTATHDRTFEGRSWSQTVSAYGRSGQLVRVLVWTGGDGVPVTCSVTVDGHRVTSQTTSGPYDGVFCKA